jgi:hypothetical protein
MVGAASVLAGFFNAPLTSSLLLFELTKDFDIVLPLMASAGLSSLINPPPPAARPAAVPILDAPADPPLASVEPPELPK